MLAELRIVDLGVIGEATLEPSPGFTAVTGETGAGKTMIVTGLSLLAGGKADPRLIRAGAPRALVEGRWLVDDAMLGQVDELGGEVETDLAEPGAGRHGAETRTVLVSRQLSPSRSRLTVGGAQVPLTGVAELVGEWVTIHGQSEQYRLGSPERQREVLDVFAGEALAPVLAAYRADYDERARLSAELAELTGQAQSRLRELDLLRFGLDEIAKADPAPGEDVELAAEAKRLQAADDLRLAARSALTALVGDESAFDEPDALGLVGTAHKTITNALAADPQLTGIADQLADASAGIADASSALATYLDSLEADPLRLEWIAGRLAELQRLTRKYGSNVDDVLAWAATSARRVGELDCDSGRIDELTARLAGLDEALAQRAAVITDARTAAASRLAESVGVELAALAMPAATLSFEVTPAATLGPHGGDQVALLFSANPGSAPGPLGRIASGGELSRVRLALEVVLAASAPGQTFVFDEVDAGVGGAVALEIGRRLRRLAGHAQVIVVTHLAQVAAFADRQFVVTKADDGQVTVSDVREASGEDRLDVLARMMGGLDDSDSARAHAAELLALCAADADQQAGLSHAEN